MKRYCSFYSRRSLILLTLLCIRSLSFAEEADKLSPEQIIAALKEASTGNIADALDETTGQRGHMYTDMRPLFKSKIVGPAATAILRPVLKTDGHNYPNLALEILDEAKPGSVLVYVLEDSLDVSGIGNLMATTAKVRGLAGAVIDGGARDVDEIEEIGLPVFSRRITPATVVGRLVSIAKQVAVQCAGVWVRPGDYVVGDATGVVVVPVEKASEVVKLIRQYDQKESKMIEIIKESKSMLKALKQYNRY